MAKIEDFYFAFWCVVALLTALATPTPILADYVDYVEKCKAEVKKLERTKEWNDGMLAVMTSDSWKKFPPVHHNNPPTHDVNISGKQGICLAWEAPPHPENHAQIVYASTRRGDNQALHLFRQAINEAFPIVEKILRIRGMNKIPYIWKLKSEFKLTLGTMDANPEIYSNFRNFHLNESVDHEDFFEWHKGTWYWGTNISSYDFVSNTAKILDGLPFGSERLLRLVPNRPYTSWVPITTLVLCDLTLSVTVSYSEDPKPVFYRYEFQPSGKNLCLN